MTYNITDILNEQYVKRPISQMKTHKKTNKPKYNITIDDTLIILDWDDTLFPTTWAINNNLDMNDIESQNRYLDHFKDLDKIVYKLLRRLMTYGKVIIVTNALPIWVNISSRVMPNTRYLLSKMKIVSARKNHQKESNKMMDWKKYAFQDQVSQLLKNNKAINIISIGDAEYEYQALIELYRKAKNPHKLLKSIKLIKDPNYNTLVDQLEVVFNAVPDVYKAEKHLDLNFKSK
jgi:hypothetical protein